MHTKPAALLLQPPVLAVAPPTQADLMWQLCPVNMTLMGLPWGGVFG